jgi:hypothetical protein
MESPDIDFAFGARRHAWGTTLSELSAAGGVGDTSRDSAITTSNGAALGLATIGAEATAPRADRPIIQLCYQLAPVAGEARPGPSAFTEPLNEAFGDPQTAEEYDLPESGEPSGSVRFYAGWNAGDFAVGLSLYGAPRRTEFGLAPGCLWLSWSPVKAAQPYLAEWRDRARELADAEPADIAGFRFAAPQLPLFGEGGKKNGKDAVLREANCVLYYPEVLPTPPAISSLVGAHGAALWRRDGAQWCASNRWDTICFDRNETSISWHDIAPAKGGGFSEVAIGAWTVRDWHDSRQIRSAVEHLENFCGVHVNHVTGYDC